MRIAQVVHGVDEGPATAVHGVNDRSELGRLTGLSRTAVVSRVAALLARQELGEQPATGLAPGVAEHGGSLQ